MELAKMYILMKWLVTETLKLDLDYYTSFLG